MVIPRQLLLLNKSTWCFLSTSNNGGRSFCSSSSSSSNNNNKNYINKFWKWTTTPRLNWKNNIKEAVIATMVFGVTGTTTMILIRPCLKTVFGLEGSLLEGPNSYRIISILTISPVYAILLFTIGTVSGRHIFFAQMSSKILGRFIPNSILSKVYCNPAKIKYNLK